MARPRIVTVHNKPDTQVNRVDDQETSEELITPTDRKATAIANRPKKIYGFLAMLIRASVIGGSSWTPLCSNINIPLPIQRARPVKINE